MKLYDHCNSSIMYMRLLRDHTRFLLISSMLCVYHYIIETVWNRSSLSAESEFWIRNTIVNIVIHHTRGMAAWYAVGCTMVGVF